MTMHWNKRKLTAVTSFPKSHLYASSRPTLCCYYFSLVWIHKYFKINFR